MVHDWDPRSLRQEMAQDEPCSLEHDQRPTGATADRRIEAQEPRENGADGQSLGELVHALALVGQARASRGAFASAT